MHRQHEMYCMHCILHCSEEKVWAIDFYNRPRHCHFVTPSLTRFRINEAASCFCILNIIKCLPSLSVASLFCSQIAIYLRGKSAIVYWNCVSSTFICHCSVRKDWSCGELSPHCNLFVMQTLCLFFLSRDGPDQSSPQIGQFSGNTALESVYSTSNIILIKFHSDFSGAGFFVLSYHGKKSLCCLGKTCMLFLSRSLRC